VTVDQRTLVQAAGRGDHDAFAMLVRGAIARLDAVARLILRDPELARDAVQEAMVRAWRDLPALRDPERFEAWLHRLTVRSCLDLIRRRRRRVIEVELQSFDGPAVHDTAVLVAQQDVLDRALRSLELENRSLVIMHYYLGLSVPEAASILGIPLGTAKSRLSRSLAQMRLVAGSDGGEEPVPRTILPARQEGRPA